MLQGMFCPPAVLRGDCKEFYNVQIRLPTPQQAAGNALAVAVHPEFALKWVEIYQ
jgi:hypothetical protein